MLNTRNPNNLINASSPYLLQHAYNPVNWQEWSDEILVQAKREDKLILISIGYSACHWCHVMEHECFEKEDTAAIMNEHFICVKIDREERPDIDQIYMDALQLITGRGGWPLNIVTLPDGRPLHGGTYFPKQEWERVLLSLSNFYRDKREEAYEFATNLSNGIRKMDQFNEGNSSENLYQIGSELLQKWKLQFDAIWGGYNWSPKFPMPNHWELFLSFFQTSKQEEFKNASYTTLIKMYEGGIYDHLEGGFARYSTDSLWKVPHFEKMLYDNAQLMSVYSMASLIFKEPIFNQVVEGINHFIQTKLRSNEGGYYSAIDADSEGVEGKFYVWSFEELHDILQNNATLFCDYFSVLPEGNWEGENILFRTKSIGEIAHLHHLTEIELEEKIDLCKKILLLERSKRINPGLDDKIITSWNALMIKAYAQAYFYGQDEKYLIEAKSAMDYLLNWSLEENQLYRIQKNGKKSIPGFSEDYACLIDALICLFEAGGEEKYLMRAYELMQTGIEQFWDEGTGLFFFANKNQKVLVTRKIDVNDDVIPSSNSIFAKVLYKLAYYFVRSDFEELSNKMLHTIATKMKAFPNGFSNWMQLIVQQERGFTQIILTGIEANEWEKELKKSFYLNTVIIVMKENSKVPLLKSKEISNEKTIAYLCYNKTCGLPIYKLEDLIKQLN